MWTRWRPFWKAPYRDAIRINLHILHLIFRSALAKPQSQNPRRSSATPAVLLNRLSQIRPEYGRNFVQLISNRILKAARSLFTSD